MAGGPAPSFSAHLELALRCGSALLWLDTLEEERAVRLAGDVCRSLGGRCLTWDAWDGLRSVLDEQPLAPVTDPTELLSRLQAMSSGTLVVLRDVAPLLEEPRHVRALRSLAQRQQPGASILLVAPEQEVPAGLRDEAVVLELPLPDRAELEALLEEVCGRSWVRSDVTAEERDQLLASASGLTCNQARRTFTKAAVVNGVLDANDVALVLEEKRALIRSAGGVLEHLEPDVDPADVGGLGALKEWLRLRGRTFSSAARSYGLPPPKGVALIGVPGTGKSLVAKTIGATWGLPLLRFDVGAIFTAYVGESEARARQALRLAEAVAPCVLWIDELEKALAHGGSDTGTSTRVFGTLLSWMSERRAPCFVVATANDVAALPPELLRRGRFDEVFFLDLPDAAEREEILAVHLRRVGRDPAAFDVRGLAHATEGFVGAELEHVLLDALVVAFDAGREVTTADVAEAVGRLVPLAVSQRERVAALRAWLREGRAVSASAPSTAIATGAPALRASHPPAVQLVEDGRK